MAKRLTLMYTKFSSRGVPTGGGEDILMNNFTAINSPCIVLARLHYSHVHSETSLFQLTP